MLKRLIKYTNFNDEEVTEEFYFNFTTAELAEMELSTFGGMAQMLKNIIATNDGGEIIRIFKKILMDSVGRRSEDGRKFIKNPEIRNDFLDSGAFSALFMELITDIDSGAKFVNGLMPGDLVKKAKGFTTADLQGTMVTQAMHEEDAADDRPKWLKENRRPNSTELRTMSKEELLLAFRWDAENNKQA